MQTEHAEQVSEVFCDVLEKLAFMFADLVEKEDIPGAGADFVKVEMFFDGAAKGRIAIAVPRGMCSELAANVLGLDEDDEDAGKESDDALKELLNVTCGNLLTSIAGEEPIFDLAPPEVSRIDDAEWQALLNDEGTLVFNVDENPVLLEFETSGSF